MSAAKHTPGPWINDNTRKSYSKQVIRHNGVIVALMPSDGSMMPLDEKEANARAIACLPELISAARISCEAYAKAGSFSGEESETAAIANLHRVLALIDGMEEVGK